LGKELYNNRDEIYSGKYKRPGASIEIIPRKSALDPPPPMKSITIFHNYGNDKVQKAVDDFNNAKDNNSNDSQIKTDETNSN
jgi:hypothetical protein